MRNVCVSLVKMPRKRKLGVFSGLLVRTGGSFCENTFRERSFERRNTWKVFRIADKIFERHVWPVAWLSFLIRIYWQILAKEDTFRFFSIEVLKFERVENVLVIEDRNFLSLKRSIEKEKITLEYFYFSSVDTCVDTVLRKIFARPILEGFILEYIRALRETTVSADICTTEF